MNGTLDWRRWLVLGLAAICVAGDAHALDPNRAISQYVREQWSSESTFGGSPIRTITQTADGYLWIGTQKGLVRYDGFNFRLITSANPLLQNQRIRGLTTDGEGKLWVFFWSASVLCYCDGKFESFPSIRRSAGQVTAMWREEDGGMVLSDSVSGILRIRKDRLEILAPPNVVPGSALVFSMAETHDGKIWLGTPAAGLFYLAKGQVNHVTAGMPDKKINSLLPGDANDLWVGTDKGLFRWNGTVFTKIELPRSVAGQQILTLLRDHNGNIWVGTTGGLLRINAAGVSFSPENKFREGGIDALFEDREGNIWAGGTSGLERIRDGTFATYAGTADTPSQSNGPVYVDEENRAWFAGAESGAYLLQDGQIRALKSFVGKDPIYSITGGKDGIWMGTRHGLKHFEYHDGIVGARTYTTADGLAENSVYAVYRSNDGAVWAGTLTGGVSKFKDGHFTNYTTADGLLSNTVSSILESRNGTLWFATPNGLSSLESGHWNYYTARDGLPSETLNCLFEDSSGILWIGTSQGLAFLQAGKVYPLGVVPDSLREPVLGLTEDKDGRFWISTSNHVLRVRREALLKGVVSAADVREYDLADGLKSTQGVSRNSSVVADTKGRIWFSTSHGISVVDPSFVADDSPPAIAHVESLLADNIPVPLGERTRIPPSRKRVTFAYTGLSLAVPERVRFRYFLEGFDRAWSDAIGTHEAAYTNLGPGSYRFRLLASNSDGAWNGSEASLVFEVQPALWQTWWFRSLCAITPVLGTLLLYRMRLHQLTRQLNLRFEERLSERTRIARELHDTLLQSLHGLMLRFQRVDNLLPERPQEAKRRLETAINEAAQAITESRDAVQGLRCSPSNTNDLAAAVTALGSELASEDTNQSSAMFELVVEGTPRNLHPILRDEAYRIAGEALRNAFGHAQAQRIEVEIRYDKKQLRLRVRDDGNGFDAKTLHREGRSGHYGLRGMRERAKLLRGNLDIWSQPGSGTEVELNIPAGAAYVPAASNERSWLSGKRSSTKQADKNER